MALYRFFWNTQHRLVCRCMSTWGNLICANHVVASTPWSQSRFVENISRRKTSWFTELLLDRCGNALQRLLHQKPAPAWRQTCWTRVIFASQCIAKCWEIMYPPNDWYSFWWKISEGNSILILGITLNCGVRRDIKRRTWYTNSEYKVLWRNILSTSH